MERTGGCLCGAVTYTATIDDTRFGACHCPMCLKWTGGPLLNVRAREVRFEGTPSTYASSAWAERGFCKECGSCLFYRQQASDGPMHIAFGTLDDTSGFRFTHQVFIDAKPEGYAFAQETSTMTRAQVMALFSGG